MHKSEWLHRVMGIPVARDLVAGYSLARKHLFRVNDVYYRQIRDDHIAPFDQYRNCLLCGGATFKDKFRTLDSLTVQECVSCGLWQTRPIIAEDVWVRWLRQESERSRRYTENRLKFGYALDSHLKFSSSLWYRRIERNNLKLIDRIEKICGRQFQSVHDVGCGVGFFLIAARDKRGMIVTGNDLNSYAVKIMKDRFGLNVVVGSIEDAEVQINVAKADLIVLNDFIEHSYNPRRVLERLSSIMKNNAKVYISTFHTDCEIAQRLGGDWDMHCWNHVSHFSKRTLTSLVKSAGLEVIFSIFPRSSPHCEMILASNRGVG